MLPAVSDFVSQNASISFVKLGNVLDGMGSLRNERALAQQIADVSKFISGGEVFNVLEQLILRHAGERVLDSVQVSRVLRANSNTTHSPVTLLVMAAMLALRLSSSMMTEPLRPFSSTCSICCVAMAF